MPAPNRGEVWLVDLGMAAEGPSVLGIQRLSEKLLLSLFLARFSRCSLVFFSSAPKGRQLRARAQAPGTKGVTKDFPKPRRGDSLRHATVAPPGLKRGFFLTSFVPGACAPGY